MKNSKILKEFAQKVKTLRLEKGWNLKELCAKMSEVYAYQVYRDLNGTF